MSSPIRDNSTDTEQITINWSKVTAPKDGDSRILAFNVQWDYGTSGFAWEDVNLPVQSFTSAKVSAQDGVTQGTSYMFRVRARNIYGFGPFSDPVKILASGTNKDGSPLILNNTNVMS